jgi:hypothetical protein
MQCKICFCDDHVQSKITAFTKEKGINCKKCLKPLSETKLLSVSARSISFGRLAYDDSHRGGDDDDDYGDGGAGYTGGYSYMNAYSDEEDVEEGFSNIKLGEYDDDFYNEEDEEDEEDGEDDEEDGEEDDE